MLLWLFVAISGAVLILSVYLYRHPRGWLGAILFALVAILFLLLVRLIADYGVPVWIQ